MIRIGDGLRKERGGAIFVGRTQGHFHASGRGRSANLGEVAARGGYQSAAPLSLSASGLENRVQRGRRFLDRPPDRIFQGRPDAPYAGVGRALERLLAL